MKKCSNCKLGKENREFSKCSNAKDGMQSYCKQCTTRLGRTKYRTTRKVSAQNWYKSNKDSFIRSINVWSKQRDGGLYRTYYAMLRRCKYPSQDGYKYYGGRGIIVEWPSYTEFKKDMYKSFVKHVEKYGRKQTTIDRIDSSKNYCKENCRWATYVIQNRHRHRVEGNSLSTEAV